MTSQYQICWLWRIGEINIATYLTRLWWLWMLLMLLFFLLLYGTSDCYGLNNCSLQYDNDFIWLTDMFKNLKMSFMTSQYQIYSVKSEKTICKRTVNKLMIQYLTIVDDLTNILIMWCLWYKIIIIHTSSIIQHVSSIERVWKKNPCFIQQVSFILTAKEKNLSLCP
jgi:hypothetical protein